MKTSKSSRKQRSGKTTVKVLGPYMILIFIKGLLDVEASVRLLSKSELKIRLECIVGLIELERKEKRSN